MYPLHGITQYFHCPKNPLCSISTTHLQNSVIILDSGFNLGWGKGFVHGVAKSQTRLTKLNWRAFYKYTRVMVAHYYECTECHWIVHFKLVNVVLCKFQLNFFKKRNNRARHTTISLFVDEWMSPRLGEVHGLVREHWEGSRRPGSGLGAEQGSSQPLWGLRNALPEDRLPERNPKGSAGVWRGREGRGRFQALGRWQIPYHWMWGRQLKHSTFITQTGKYVRWWVSYIN